MVENYKEHFPIPKKVTHDVLNSPQGDTPFYDFQPVRNAGNIPITIFTGMGSGPGVVERVVHAFAEGGGNPDNSRRTIVAFPNKHGGSNEEIKESELGIDFKLPKEIVRKAQAYLAVLRSRGISEKDKTAAVGHSEGGLVLVVAALIAPELFSNIVLLDAAGMVKKHSLLTLMRRQFAENGRLAARRATSQDQTFQDALDVSGKVFMNHIRRSRLRFLEELRAVSGTEIHQIIKILHRKGIGITLVQCTEDNVFPMNEFQEAAKTFVLSGERSVEYFPLPPLGIDGAYTIKGNHNEILYDPERYARVIEAILTAMEKKQAKKQSE